MSDFRIFVEATSGIQVFHGSNEPELDHVKANAPPYAGGIGHGVYVGTEIETAQFYGKHIYELRTKFDWDQVLSIGEDNYEPLGYESSILTGEQVYPFAFQVKDKKYAVVDGTGWAEKDNWVTRDVRLKAFYQYLGIDDSGYNIEKSEESPDWVDAIIPAFKDRNDRFDIDDFDDYLYTWVDQYRKGIKYPGPKGTFLPGEVGVMGLQLYNQKMQSYEQALEQSVEKIKDYIQQAIDHADQAVENIGEQISMEEIGGVVESAGYKAVHVVGIRYNASVNEEMLVFNENDLQFVRKIQ